MNDQQAAIDRHLAKPFWPWGLALAYCQPRDRRNKAIAAVAEVLDTYSGKGEGLTRFLGSSSLFVVYEAFTGGGNSAIDWDRFAEIEALLVATIEVTSIESFGRRSPDASLESIDPLEWVGAEIDGDATCDLVKAGWRATPLLEKALGEERIVRFFDIHLRGDAVRQLVDAADAARAPRARPASPKAPRRGSKPGQKRRPAELERVLCPIFRRHHDAMSDMSRAEKTRLGQKILER